MWRPALLAAFLLICGLAAVLRLAALDTRVVHGDEAIHFVRFSELRSTGVYHYDPHDYHGPTLYYFTLPVGWILGVDDPRDLEPRHYRLVPALFGIATILLLPLLRDGLGRLAIVVAAALIALSPALCFHSRNYIQESLLGFFTLALLACGWRFSRSRHPAWLLCGGACLGLMHATKETFVLAVLCAAAALLVTAGPGRTWRVWRRSRRLRRLAAFSLLLAGLVSVACFSVAFTQPAGPLDSLRTFWLYFDRAGGAGLHAQPWWWYLANLLHVHYPGGPHWTEALLLLSGAAGAGLAFIPAAPTSSAARPHGQRLPRFLAVYTLLLTAAYSLIPYKTPWCSVQFLIPLALLGGYAVRRVFIALADSRARTAFAALVTAAGLHLGWQARQASFTFANDDRNPHVYAHPTRGVVRLADWIEQLADCQPAGRDVLIHVFAENPWPLPWYLRRFGQVGYWESPTGDCGAPIVIADDSAADAVAACVGPGYHRSHYGLRRDATLHVFIDPALWQAFRDAPAARPD